MKISIVIPCHNVAEHLPACLDSALNSDHADLEIICVDDGSADDTLTVIQSYAERWPDKIRTASGSNQGASAARNKGMSLATGAYIQFLDGDDVLMQKKISRQVALIQENGDADLIVGNYEKKLMDGARIEVEALAGDPWMALIRTELGTTSANLWKKSLLDKIGGWDESLKSSQDYELMFRMLCEDAKVLFDPSYNTLILKREKGSISRTGQKDNWVRYIELRASMKAHLKTKDADQYEEHISCLDQYIFMALRVLAHFDVPLSIEFYKRHLGRAFKPETSQAIDKRYILFYNLLGFPTAERLIHAVKRSAA